MRRAYLDHASSSPLRPAALEAMLPYLREHHADPGRLHAEGGATRAAVERAREQVAELVGARPREVVFTSGGTEAVNAAVWGAVEGRRDRVEGPGHVVTTAVEHSAVLDSCRRSRCEVTTVGVDRLGRFDAAEVAAAIRPDTVLVSVQLANHEVGTLQPAAGVAAAGREAGVLVHVDACTAVGHVPLAFGALGADLCSVTAHKLGGPKGAGALLVRRGLRVPPFVVGGAQERARRGGLENVPAIVGFGAAAALLAGGRSTRRRPAPGPSPTGWRPPLPRSSEASGCSATPRRGSRTSSAWAWRGWRPSRSCSGSTSRASPCTRALRAPARRSSRRPSCWPWGSTPIARCGSRWAGARPARTSTPCSAPSPTW
ncbi:MAG: aminotransferase class V-fold PLP-dependent enzyme [Acidimicrobiia bacterium]|nr:aminotransferase class V-fold PLP-dependent enzyme [Acidimicrobiia bacterium]